MKKVYVFISVFIVCVLLVIYVLVLKSEPFSDISPITVDGEYIIHTSEQIPRMEITSFMIYDDEIYVLFEQAALVNVYSVDGTYAYGIQFCTGSNGRSDMAFYDGRLLIDSRRASIYSFNGTQLIDHLSSSQRMKNHRYFRDIFEEEKNIMLDNRKCTLSEGGNQIVFLDTLEPIISYPKKNDLLEVTLNTAMVFAALSIYFYPKICQKQ